MKRHYLVLIALLLLAVACAPAIDTSETDKAPADTADETPAEDAAETSEESVEVSEELAEEPAPEETPAEVTEEVTEEAQPEEMDKPSNETAEVEMEESNVTVLAKNISVYYEWDRATFDKAVKEGKSVLLVFSTDTYPQSVKQDKAIIQGFKQIRVPRLVGFRVPYKDSRMTPEHDELSVQYGVGTIMTKVLLKNGQITYKNSEAWDTQDFVRKMTQFS